MHSGLDAVICGSQDEQPELMRAGGGGLGIVAAFCALRKGGTPLPLGALGRTRLEQSRTRRLWRADRRVLFCACGDGNWRSACAGDWHGSCGRAEEE